MTSQDVRVLATNRTTTETRNLVANTVRAMGWTISTIDETGVVAKTPVSIRSFGEVVTITISDGQLTIHSQASLGFTIADWGKNRENTQLLASNLSRYIGPSSLVAPAMAQFDPLNNQPEPFLPASATNSKSIACPFCGSKYPPIATKKFSSEGWFLVLFALVFCFPVAFALLFIPQMYKTTNKCVSCGNPFTAA